MAAAKEVRQPGARGDDQLSRRVGRPRCPDLHRFAVLLKTCHGLVEADGGAVRFRKLELRLHAGLGADEPADLVEIERVVVAQIEGGETPPGVEA